eukprot:114229_1
MSWTNGYTSIHNEWLCILFFSSYVLVFLFLVESIRRFSICDVFWFSIMPFILTALLLMWNDDNTVFLWVKLYSVIIGCWILQLIRYRLESWKENNKQISSVIVWCAYFVLALNILEAVIAELKYLIDVDLAAFIGNALNGVVLILTQASPINITTSDNRFTTVRYRLGWIWMIDFTFWDSIYVFNYYTIFAYGCNDMEHILFAIKSILLHLIAPLIIVTWTYRDEWLQYRAHALCLGLYINVISADFIYYLPFLRIQENHCKEYRNGALLITKLFSWISFMFGIVVLVKDIYDEIASWNGKEKAHDYSLIQWIISRFRAKKDIEQGNEMQNCIENSNNNNTSKMYDTVTNGVNVVEDNDTIHV